MIKLFESLPVLVNINVISNDTDKFSLAMKDIQEHTEKNHWDPENVKFQLTRFIGMKNSPPYINDITDESVKNSYINLVSNIDLKVLERSFKVNKNLEADDRLLYPEIYYKSFATDTTEFIVNNMSHSGVRVQRLVNIIEDRHVIDNDNKTFYANSFQATLKSWQMAALVISTGLLVIDASNIVSSYICPILALDPSGAGVHVSNLLDFYFKYRKEMEVKSKCEKILKLHPALFENQGLEFLAKTIIEENLHKRVRMIF